MQVLWNHLPENTNNKGSAVCLVFGFTGLDSIALQYTKNIRFSCLVESKPYKLEIGYTVIFPPMESVLYIYLSTTRGKNNPNSKVKGFIGVVVNSLGLSHPLRPSIAFFHQKDPKPIFNQMCHSWPTLKWCLSKDPFVAYCLYPFLSYQ